MSPWIVGFCVFLAYPIAMSIYYSLCNFSVLQPPKFVGLSNYTAVFADPLFWSSFKITLIFMVLVAPARVILSFLLAIVLIVVFLLVRQQRTTRALRLRAEEAEAITDPSWGPDGRIAFIGHDRINAVGSTPHNSVAEALAVGTVASAIAASVSLSQRVRARLNSTPCVPLEITKSCTYSNRPASFSPYL